MAVNLIVGAVTLLMSGFVLLWLTSRRARRWFELPKSQELDWELPDPALSGPRWLVVRDQDSIPRA
jgi:hypothetical protein